LIPTEGQSININWKTPVTGFAFDGNPAQKRAKAKAVYIPYKSSLSCQTVCMCMGHTKIIKKFNTRLPGERSEKKASSASLATFSSVCVESFGVLAKIQKQLQSKLLRTRRYWLYMTIVLRASARRRILFTPHPVDAESKSFLPRIPHKVKDSTRPKTLCAFAGLSLFSVSQRNPILILTHNIVFFAFSYSSLAGWMR